MFYCDNLLAEEHHRGAILAEPARPNQLGPGVARAVEEDLQEGGVQDLNMFNRIRPGKKTNFLIFGHITMEK